MAVRRDNLGALLSAAGIEASGLKTLREVAVEDNDDLAGTLMNSSTWYFWWD